MHKHLYITIAALGVAWAPQSSACPYAGEQRSILRVSVPFFPGEASVLGIQVTRYRREPPHGVDAIVTRVANGPAVRAITIVSTSSCDQLLKVGERGVVVGGLSRLPNGTYQLRPVPEQSLSVALRARRKLLEASCVVMGLIVSGWFILWVWKQGRAA